ncbi:tetratricopeptide repeat protein [Aerosakkonemataceae cyanobacterium BLCC-F50]|uniref:Tetratricopeptide repeat protein n=1 Tax=Floridaenema flaviceps BLCC-F50 TaxID=3153642 RepID=A0ABV4XPF0_9CYAN
MLISHQNSQTGVDRTETYQVLHNQGCLLLDRGNYQEALTYFDQVLALDPQHQQAWAFRGAVLIFLERYTEALSSCDRALLLNPKDSETWVMHGVALQRLDRYKQAYNSYDRALGIERKPILKQLFQPILSLIKRLIRQLPSIGPAR